MKNYLFTLTLLICTSFIFAQPTGYHGFRLNGANMTNETFLYNSPGFLPSNSRLLLQYKDSTYMRILYNNLRIDYLKDTTSMYLAPDGLGNILKFPITNIFNPNLYYTKTMADAVFLQSFTEADPIFIADSNLFVRDSDVYNRIQSDIRYLQSFTELDPIFLASPAFGINGTQISNWNTAFSWGNHSGLYPLLSGSYSNPTWITDLPWTKITGVPSIPAAQVNSDWNSVSGVSQILNKPTIPAQVNISAGTGISVTGTYPNITVTNIAPNITPTIIAGQNTKITGTWPNITIADSSSVYFYNSSGRVTQTKFKIWTGSVVPSTGNGYSVNISSAGFSTIMSVSVTSESNTNSTTVMRNVELKSFTTSTAVVNIAQPNATAIALLGLTLLGVPTFNASDKLHVTVIGY